MSTLQLQLADRAGIAWAQQQVTEHHYLRRPVDTRCSVLAYLVMHEGECVGCLIFGRPEATRCYPWYGSVEDVANGKARLSRWEVVNLARVWLHPCIQAGGERYVPNAATRAIGQALRRVVADYLLRFPPCFPDEPYELRECLSYCDTSLHRGTIYRAASFRLERENRRGIQTYARPLRRLSYAERALVLARCDQSPRSRRMRAERVAKQLQLM